MVVLLPPGMGYVHVHPSCTLVRTANVEIRSKYGSRSGTYCMAICIPNLVVVMLLGIQSTTESEYSCTNLMYIVAIQICLVHACMSLMCDPFPQVFQWCLWRLDWELCLMNTE